MDQRTCVTHLPSLELARQGGTGYSCAAGKTPGKITLTASGEGLDGTSVEVLIVK
jgi:hypothetical protein